MVEIACIDPQQVAHVWPLARPFIARAFLKAASDTTLEAVAADVARGAQLLWVAIEGNAVVAAATTELIAVPAGKICAVTAAGGVHTRLWDVVMPKIEAYARAEGCGRVRIAGRRGWARVLKGYRVPWIVVEKDLA